MLLKLINDTWGMPLVMWCSAAYLACWPKSWAWRMCTASAVMNLRPYCHCKGRTDFGIRATPDGDPRIALAENSCRVTLSMGVANGPQPAAVLFEQADQALYKSKSVGRNCWHYFTRQDIREDIEESVDG
ncbi:GGDEF domain-containing protein [Plesiomonas shigelloides subsp. oncorhynchi]|nr:GGDEF domain-containing protein [Plesiomonas shigelloides]